MSAFLVSCCHTYVRLISCVSLQSESEQCNFKVDSQIVDCSQRDLYRDKARVHRTT
jgi:hypothetical protein